MLSGYCSSASNIRARCQGPGVTVVALVPSAGPGAAADEGGDARRPAPRRRSAGQMKWTCASMAPAVRIRPLPAMTSVSGPITRSGWTPSMVSGLPALPMPVIRPSRMPTSALTMPQWSRTTAPVMTVSGVPSARRGARLAHGLADHLAAAEDRLVAGESGAAADGPPRSRSADRCRRAGCGRRWWARTGRRTRPREISGIEGTSGLPAQSGHDAARRRSGRVRRRPGSRARSARRCRRRCSAACRARRRGRTPGRGWPRRSGSGSRPGRAGRRR